MPGAPGIGVKTAAQLIDEYGDLETLLARAGEIKQPKRRETLTNPETVKLIRISKTLVTLVRDVETEVALDDLGMPKLEGEKLIAFLKAMEFTTITRRVGEICGIDANAIEPDPRFAGPGGWRARNGEAAEAREPSAAPQPAPPEKAEKRASDPTPQALAAERAASARNEKLDVSAYKTVTTAEELGRWIARALRDRCRRLRHRDDIARSDPGRSRRRFACGRAGRGLLHPDRPYQGRGRSLRRRRARAGTDRRGRRARIC